MSTGPPKESWSIGNAAVVPFITRALVVLERDIGAYQWERGGQGRKFQEIHDTDANYKRFRRHYQDILEQSSFMKTWDEVWRWCHGGFP